MSKNRQKGFSMIESVVATALLGLMAFFGLSLSVMSLKGVDHARNQSQAKALAHAALTNWGQRAFEGGYGIREAAREERNGVEYLRIVKVLPVTGQDLRRVEVSVTWSWRDQSQKLVRAKWVRHAG